MGKRSKANKEDTAKIQELYDNSVPPEKIVEEMDEVLYPKAVERVINAYKSSKVAEKGKEAVKNLEQANTFHKIEGDEIEEIAEPPSPEIDKEGWQEVAEDAIDEIMSYNVEEEQAVRLVKEAMDKIDLSQEPDVQAITSVAFSNSNELLKRHSNNGQSVVSMTGAGSLAGENVVKKQGSTKYEAGIFRPNAPKRQRFM